MKMLSACPSGALSGPHPYRAELVDPKTGMGVAFSSDSPIDVRRLDDDVIWGTSGKRPDGVLIAGGSSSGLVCFLELKGAIDPDDPDRPFDQVLAGIDHFAPSKRTGGTGTHGDEHHERFENQSDFASARKGRKEIPIFPDPDHVVAGAIFTSRGGTRHPPRVELRAGKTVRIVVVQRHGPRGRVECPLDELLAQIVP